MRLCLFLLVCPVTILSIFALSCSATDGQGAQDRVIVEKYRYEALPAGEADPEKKEVIDVEITSSDKGVQYRSTDTSRESSERVQIATDARGGFIVAVRSKTVPSKDNEESERIWRDERKVYVERKSGSTDKVGTHEIPKGRTLAVDASLLVLLRHFPFDEGKEWDLFMVDFSGRTVTVTVRQTGEERVLTPAGELDCYRMEVAVNIPLIGPKITYWLSKERPHFLVRHSGRRGPFTSSYITTLVSRQ